MKNSGKYYSLMAIGAILLLGTLANAPDAYAAKPTKLTMLYTNDGGGPVTIDVKRGSDNYNTDPSDPPNPPTDDGVTVSSGQTFMVLPITLKTTLESETQFFIGANEFFFW